MSDQQKKGQCQLCDWEGVLTKNGRMRSHKGDPDKGLLENGNCPKGSDLPREAVQPVPKTASGGPNPHRPPLAPDAPLGDAPCGAFAALLEQELGPVETVLGRLPAATPTYDPACDRCDTDTHRCPGCGAGTDHATVVCADCRVFYADDLPKETETVNPEAAAQLQREDVAQTEPEHIHRFEYGDDGQFGHAGSFCACGLEEPSLSELAAQDAADFFGGDTPSEEDAAADFFDSDEPEQAPSKGRWFPSRYDGSCDTCGAYFSEGDEIRADGEGGWECRDHDEEDADPDDAPRTPKQPRPRQVSPKPPLDSGRYNLPHPLTGKPSKFSRVTTWVKAASDHFSLKQWEMRSAVVGLAKSPDLLARVEGLDVKADAKALNALADMAKDAAGAKDKANVGTKVHKWTEEVDSGRLTLEQVPEEFRARVGEYRVKLAQSGCTVLPHLIERTTVEPVLGVVGTFDQVWACPDGVYRIVDKKGLALTERIPTPTGWTTMGAVQVGDIVFDGYGKQCTVTDKSRTKRIGTYIVRFDDKSSVVCDVEHIWWTRANGENEPTAKTIEEVIGTLRSKRGQSHHRVPVPGPLELPDTELPIDPYLLGCWLGDGARRGGLITKGRDLFEILEQDGHTLGVEQPCHSDQCVSRTVAGLTTALHAEGLLHNKRIPEQYLRAGTAQRLALLRGLMDTDGCWNKARLSAVFTSTDKQLALQVEELLLSLGQRPNFAGVRAKGFGKETTCYHVNFTPVDMQPFRIPRKADQVKPGPGGALRSRQRIIVAVEPGPDVETACIGVDSRTHTYLCGDRMIPTHNTGRIEYDRQEIEAQLAIYAHGANTHGVAQWDPELGEASDPAAWVWRPLTDNDGNPIQVSNSSGIVVHMPQDGSPIRLLEVDLVKGWAHAELCARVKDSQRGNKAFPLLEFAGSPAPEPAPQAAPDAGSALLARVVPQQEQRRPSFSLASPAPVPTDFGAPAAPVAKVPTVRLTWAERFAAVKSKQDASALLREARDAGMPKERQTLLIAVATQALENLEPEPPF